MKFVVALMFLGQSCTGSYRFSATESSIPTWTAGCPTWPQPPWVRISGRDFLSGRPQSFPSLAPGDFGEAPFGFSVLAETAALVTSFRRSRKFLFRKV